MWKLAGPVVDPTVARSVRPEIAAAVRIWDTGSSIAIRLRDTDFEMPPEHARKMAALLIQLAEDIEKRRP